MVGGVRMLAAVEGGAEVSEMDGGRMRGAGRNRFGKGRGMTDTLLRMLAVIFIMALATTTILATWVAAGGEDKIRVPGKVFIRKVVGKIANATKAGLAKYRNSSNSAAARKFRERAVFIDGDWIMLPGSSEEEPKPPSSRQVKQQDEEKVDTQPVSDEAAEGEGGGDGAADGDDGNPPVSSGKEDSGAGAGAGAGGKGIALCPENRPSGGNECSSFISPFAHRRRAKGGEASYGAEAFSSDIAQAVQNACSMLWTIDRGDPRSLLFATRGQMSNVFIQYFYMRVVADSHGLRLHENKHTGTLKKVNMAYNKSEARSTRSLRHFRYVTLFEEGLKTEVLPNAKCGQFYQNYEYFRSERCFAQCLFAPGQDSISNEIAGMGCADPILPLCFPPSPARRAELAILGRPSRYAGFCVKELLCTGAYSTSMTAGTRAAIITTEKLTASLVAVSQVQ